MPITHEDYGPLKLEVDSDTMVAVVTLDRPPVNAIDRATHRAMNELFSSLGARRDVNAVVLAAAGRTFCAGVDLNERGREQAEKPLDPGRSWRDAKASILECSVPVIAAVQGAAIGAGLGLVSMCDFIIASEEARFGLTEINVGLLGGGSAAMRLVGRGTMRKMYFTGELLGAEEMHRLGAVASVVPSEQLLPEARAIAERIAEKSPIALRLAKESLNRLEEYVLPFETAYRMEQDYTIRLRTFEDASEGARAFAEKRKPKWQWR
jgi:enoyl-CoA hydratase